MAAALAGTSGATVTYDDAANTITITGIGDPETMRDTIGAALVGVGVVTVTVDDAGKTITISSTATANSTDAALRDRSTHTGNQLASTISDFATAADARVAAAVGVSVQGFDAELAALAGLVSAADKLALLHRVRRSGLGRPVRLHPHPAGRRHRCRCARHPGRWSPAVARAGHRPVLPDLPSSRDRCCPDQRPHSTRSWTWTTR